VKNNKIQNLTFVYVEINYVYREIKKLKILKINSLIYGYKILSLHLTLQEFTQKLAIILMQNNTVQRYTRYLLVFHTFDLILEFSYDHLWLKLCSVSCVCYSCCENRSRVLRAGKLTELRRNPCCKLYCLDDL